MSSRCTLAVFRAVPGSACYSAAILSLNAPGEQLEGLWKLLVPVSKDEEKAHPGCIQGCTKFSLLFCCLPSLFPPGEQLEAVW